MALRNIITVIVAFILLSQCSAMPAPDSSSGALTPDATAAHEFTIDCSMHEPSDQEKRNRIRALRTGLEAMWMYASHLYNEWEPVSVIWVGH